MPQAALHSSEVAETWFAWQSMPVKFDFNILIVYFVGEGSGTLTEIHDMVPTDGAVVNDDVPCP